jgi:hypothetical protein
LLGNSPVKAPGTITIKEADVFNIEYFQVGPILPTESA